MDPSNLQNELTTASSSSSLSLMASENNSNEEEGIVLKEEIVNFSEEEDDLSDLLKKKFPRYEEDMEESYSPTIEIEGKDGSKSTMKLKELFDRRMSEHREGGGRGVSSTSTVPVMMNIKKKRKDDDDDNEVESFMTLSPVISTNSSLNNDESNRLLMCLEKMNELVLNLDTDKEVIWKEFKHLLMSQTIEVNRIDDEKIGKNNNKSNKMEETIMKKEVTKKEKAIKEKKRLLRERDMQIENLKKEIQVLRSKNKKRSREYEMEMEHLTEVLKSKDRVIKKQNSLNTKNGDKVVSIYKRKIFLFENQVNLLKDKLKKKNITISNFKKSEKFYKECIDANQEKKHRNLSLLKQEIRRLGKEKKTLIAKLENVMTTSEKSEKYLLHKLKKYKFKFKNERKRKSIPLKERKEYFIDEKKKEKSPPKENQKTLRTKRIEMSKLKLVLDIHKELTVIRNEYEKSKHYTKDLKLNYEKVKIMYVKLLMKYRNALKQIQKEKELKEM